MAKYIVYTEGTADTDREGIAYSRMDAFLIEKKDGSYTDTLRMFNATKFDSIEDAEAAIASYRSIFAFRHKRCEISEVI